jgi:hypothetical protein
MGTFSNIVN